MFLAICKTPWIDLSAGSRAEVEGLGWLLLWSGIWASGDDWKHQDRIVVDPHILAGKPIVLGTRIPVELVLKRLAEDLDLDRLFEAYPRLTREDIQACIEYAPGPCLR